MNNLICKNCGHRVLYFGTDFYDELCEICGKKMYLERENEQAEIEQLVNEDKDYYTIEEIIEMDLVRSMKDNIKIKGHGNTWNCIEKLKNAKQRIVFRQGFFKAQGKIPETNLKELGL